MKKSKYIIIIALVAVAAIVGGVSLWNYHEKPEFCTLCHIMTPYVETWQDSNYQVRLHAEEGLECLDCHEPTIVQQVTEVAMFVTKKYEDPLVSRNFPEEFCLRCHGSLPDLIERTKDYTILNQPHNPHDPHPGKDASIVSHFECWNCHKMHRTSQGTEFCFSACHHERTFQVCSECHDESGGVIEE